MRILAMLLCLVSVICWIIVLIKQFQNGGVVHGIIGIITCGIWTLIWGWMNATKLGIKNIMLIWTVVYVAAWVLTMMSGGFSYSLGTPVTP